MGPTANVGNAPDGRRCPRPARPVTAFGGFSPPLPARLALPGVPPGVADVDGPVGFARAPARASDSSAALCRRQPVSTGTADASRRESGFHRRAVVVPNPACAWSGTRPSPATAAAATRRAGAVLLRNLGLHSLPAVLASAPIPLRLGSRRSGRDVRVLHVRSGDCQLVSRTALNLSQSAKFTRDPETAVATVTPPPGPRLGVCGSARSRYSGRERMSARAPRQRRRTRSRSRSSARGCRSGGPR